VRIGAASHFPITFTSESTMPTRKANATWEGGLKGGRGQFSGESGAIEGRYSAGSRFEEAGGSNPEELIAAANAACFSMALSAALEREGASPTRVHTDAACSIEKADNGFKITRMKLTTRAQVSGVDEETFQRVAEAAKEGCPVSQALKGNVKIELDATLE
jgi:lipoyl-dependent peroxiredoxin